MLHTPHASVHKRYSFFLGWRGCLWRGVEANPPIPTIPFPLIKKIFPKMKWWSMKGQGVILTPSLPSPPPPSFHFHNILSWEYYSQKPWIIPYPCHLVPFSERECQPNVKREVMIHLDSEERIFLHNTPMSLLVFSPSLQLLSLIDCWYVAQNYLNVVNLFSVSSSPVISWPSLLIFFFKFSTSLWTGDSSFARVDVSSLK